MPPLLLWWVWVAFAVANVADFLVQGTGSARFTITVSAVLAAITGLAYALALRPRLIADQVGLTIVNPFRDHHVPWTAVRALDAGDWVRVHCVPGGSAPGVESSAAGKVVSCWALYVSARTKRNAARPPVRPRGGWLRPALFGHPGEQPRYEADARLPEDAKYLASLPPARAIAARLDARAAKERRRAAQAGAGPPLPVTARWAWFPLAAVAVPALALLAVVLA